MFNIAKEEGGVKMPAASLLGLVLQKIPWAGLLRYGPSMVEAATSLVTRNRDRQDNAITSLEARVDKLERNETEQAKLVSQMAEQQELLAKTAAILNARIRLLVVAVVLLTACSVTALILAVVK